MRLWDFETILVTVCVLVGSCSLPFNNPTPTPQNQRTTTPTSLPPSNQVPHICRAFFTPGDGMVRNEQAKAVMWLTRPKLTSTWAAGFAFNKVCI